MSEPWTPRKRLTIAAIVLLAAPGVAAVAAAALFIGFIFAWFHAGAFYSGDGTYRRGVDVAAFQVEFPAVDLSRNGRHTFRFTRLAPPMSYAVGFRVLPELPSASRPSATVSMTMQNDRGQIVFQEKRPLSEWHWRRNMAVIQGQSLEVPIGGGSVRTENRGVGPDGGWGTYFFPRWDGRYTLTIEVLQPDPAAGRWVVHPVIEGYTASL